MPLGAAQAGAALPAPRASLKSAQLGNWITIPALLPLLCPENFTLHGAQQHHRCCKSRARNRGNGAATAAHAPPLSHRDTEGFTVQGGAIPHSGRAARTLHNPCPSVCPSLPSTRGSRPGRGCSEWGSGGCELKRHTCGEGGEDTGQEAPRLYTSICMPNPLPGSGASGPPSAPQLTSLVGWFPSRHRAEVGVEQRGEKGGCSHPHAPSHIGRLGGSCSLPELVDSALGAERGVGGGGGLFLQVPGMFLCSRLPPGQCEGHRAPPRPSWMLPTL